MLSRKITEYNQRLRMSSSGSREMAINLRGIMVGNGCIGHDLGACSSLYDLSYAMPFLHGHALISNEAYDEILENCNGERTPTSPACVDVVNKAYTAVGNININDVLSPCVVVNDSRDAFHTLRIRQRLSNISGLPDCKFATYTTAYMRSRAVQNALHIVPDTELGVWQPCSNPAYDFYNQTVASILPDYVAILGTVRVLIYNGDVDSNVPYTDNEEWTSSFAREQSLDTVSKWNAWLTFDGQVRYLDSFFFHFGTCSVTSASKLFPL